MCQAPCHQACSEQAMYLCTGSQTNLTQSYVPDTVGVGTAAEGWVKVGSKPFPYYSFARTIVYTSYCVLYYTNHANTNYDFHVPGSLINSLFTKVTIYWEAGSIFLRNLTKTTLNHY